MPTRTLTARFVKTVKPGADRVDYFDAGCAGLALRVSVTTKTWVLLYRTQPTDEAPDGGGRLRRLTLGRYPDLSLKRARIEAFKERGKVASGKDPATVKQDRRREAARAGDTVADLAKDYIAKWAKVNKRSWRDDQRYLDAEILPAWKHRKVKSITRRDVRALIDGIADRGSPISANRCLALVRKMLNFGIAKDWIDGNPAALIEKPGAEHSRERVLTDDELRLVWATCEGERPALCALMRLRLLTAQRGAEVAAMRWEDVDLETGWWTLPSTITKNKRQHRVFLTAAALALVMAQPQIDDSPWVFPGRTNRPVSDAKKAGRRIATRVLAELRTTDPTITAFDFRGHDLRRTAATKMAEAGISQTDIGHVLNHAEGGAKATQVYNRYQYDREIRIALETWARVLAGILESHPTTNVVPMARRASQ